MVVIAHIAGRLRNDPAYEFLLLCCAVTEKVIRMRSLRYRRATPPSATATPSDCSASTGLGSSGVDEVDPSFRCACGTRVQVHAPLEPVSALEVGPRSGHISSCPATAIYYLDRQVGCEADYYTGPNQRCARWFGDGARAVGLTGPQDRVNEAALGAMLDYADAVRHAGERIDARRAGVDVTVSAPRSVSSANGRQRCARSGCAPSSSCNRVRGRVSPRAMLSRTNCSATRSCPPVVRCKYMAEATGPALTPVSA